jgi:hypothetical protein
VEAETGGARRAEPRTRGANFKAAVDAADVDDADADAVTVTEGAATGATGAAVLDPAGAESDA